MATVELCLQDGNANESALLERLLEQCRTASGGGGIFAWTNASGVISFLKDRSFKEFVKESRFELVVGLDSITDESAVNALVSAVERAPNLSVWAFLHSDGALFHPKLAWFESGPMLTLIVGSGNLTMGGLKNNWEAYVIARMVGREARHVSRDIRAWLTKWSHCLVPINDERVLQRAKGNAGSERSLRRTSSFVEGRAAEAGNSVLVAEIPRQTGRSSQANFDRENYEEFFGARVGSPHRIVLYHVDADGTLGEVESRPSVEVRSQNYRFELSGLRRIRNSEGSHPIGLFMRIRTGEYLYMLLDAEDPRYVTLQSFLQSHFLGNSRQLRRYRTTVQAVRSVWPEAPLWQVQLPAL